MEHDSTAAAYDLIYLVSCSANNMAPDLQRCQTMNCPALFQMARRHLLTVTAAFALEQAVPLPSYFIEEKYKAIRRLSLYEAERDGIFAALDKHAIWHMPLKGIVLADRNAPATFYNGNRIYLIPEVCSTDLTMDLIGSGADRLLLPGCRGFETPEETDRNLIVSPVLRSGEGSYLKAIDAMSVDLEKKEGDLSGPFALALQARRVTGEGFLSRAFIIGCSGALVNEQVYAMTDIQQLIVRTAEFLLDLEASDLDILAKEAIRPALGTGSIGPGAVMLAALPAGVLLAALLVLKRRRNR